MSIDYILPPLVGALIGLLTNYVAIKMLFRPYRAIRILGVRLPFTPGVIPREHKRLARKVGEIVGNHLVTPENLHDLFRSPSVQEKVKQAIGNSFSQFGILSSLLNQDLRKRIALHLVDIIDRELPAVLQGLAIDEQVTEKIHAFSLPELEAMIMSVAHRQLAYITYFGAFLGALVGSVQLLL